MFCNTHYGQGHSATFPTRNVLANPRIQPTALRSLRSLRAAADAQIVSPRITGRMSR